MSLMPLITIQSAGRVGQVDRMLEALSPLIPTWYVPAAQAEEYELAGARVRAVEGTLPMKPKQQNAALDDGFAEGRIVVLMDDDFLKAQMRDWSQEDKFIVVDVPLHYVIKEMVTELEASNKFLAINAHMFNMRWSRPDSGGWGNGAGVLMVHKPNQARYDEQMNDTEDLDMVVQHHLYYGGLVKLRKFNAEFHFHRPHFDGGKDKSYSGGYEGHRTDDSTMATARYLNQKYPFLKFEEVGINLNMFKNIKWRDFYRE